MEFNKLFFIMIFMPVFIGLMYLINNNKARNILIVIFSLCFYALGNYKYLYLIIGISLLSYFSAKIVKDNKKIYFSYLVFIVSFLAFFKYGYYLKDTFTIFDNIIMPLGVSFYVFTSISYVSDCYYGKIEADNNYLNVLTFTTFFPTVVSGPLLRYKPFKEYLNHKEINTDTIAGGLRLFIIGLAKKVIIANQLGAVSAVVFAEDTTLSFLLAWYGVLSFALQLYFDFSGYSDMAIGLAKMIGFEIPVNFNYPYISVSIQDFWRRWHISLSTWFKDYIYIPLGGNRVKTARFILNTMIVWTLTGIWHGSTFNFVLWGIYNGILLLIHKFFIKDRINNKLIMWALTMLAVVIGWTIFNTISLAQLALFLKAMLGSGAFDMNYIKGLNILNKLPYFGIASFGMFPLFNKFLQLINKKAVFVYDLYLLAILFISIVFIVSGSYSAFIYFGF